MFINVINNFDKQKNAVLKAYGCEPLDYFDAAKWRNEESLTIDAMESFKRFADSSNKGPTSLNHRYLLEDVPMGLCLFSSLGRVAGLDTSVADSIVILASALLNRDFIGVGRTIGKMLGKDENEISVADVMRIIS